MAQRSAGNPLVGYSDGSEERLDETSVASQIRAREAAIAREADSENMSPSQSPTSSTNPDTNTPTAARRVRGPIFTTVARKSPDAPRAARPQHGLQAGNLNDMFSWDHGQLAEHLMAREAGETVLRNCQQFELDGSAFRVFVSDSSGQPRSDLTERLDRLTGDDTPRWFITRICIDIELALEWYRSCMATPEHSHYSLKDLANIKIPSFPKGKGLDGRLTPDQLKNHITSIRSRLNVIDKAFSIMVQEIADQPTAVRAQVIMEMLSPSQVQLDEILGQCFVDASTEKTMEQIITMKKHIHNSSYSGITTLQAMCESITKLTGPKLGQQLLKVFEPIVKPPIESMAKLEASYKQHCDALTLLQGVDINLDPIIQTFLLHEMVSKL